MTENEAVIQRERHFDGRDLLCYRRRPRDMRAMFDAAVARAPDRIAVHDANGAMSYGALDATASRLAAGLRRLGLDPGDRLAINMSNRSEFVVAIIACFKAGIIAMPVGHRHRKAELCALFADAGVRAVLFDGETAGEQPTRADVDTLDFLIGIGATRRDARRYGDILDLADPLAPDEMPAIDAEATAVLLYTSGTTGRPKGARLTHLGMVHSVLHFQNCLGLRDAECTVLAVPASHVTGLVAQILTMIGCAGTTVMMPRFDVEDFTALARDHAMTWTILVPAMYALMLHRNALSPEGLENWRIGGFGGAPMPGAVRDALARVLPRLSLHNAYGATETTSPTTIVPLGVADPGDSVGLVVPCGEVRIVDEAGADLPDGKTGELLIKGPMVVPGYWNNPQADAASFERGYWKSGDVASRDAHGFIRILDRIKDMINRGGYKIFSAEIENLLMRIDGVQEAALVPYPCPILGERAQAFVFAGSTEIEAAELRRFLAERVADYKLPDRITLCASPLPRNVNGKIVKAVLRQRALNATDD